MDLNRLIYIHIPKTGGWSMANTLIGMGLRKMYEHDFSKTIKNRLGDEEFKKHFNFTIVRNPWDRLLSSYTFLTKGSNIHRPPESLTLDRLRIKSFEEFIDVLHKNTKDFGDAYLIHGDNRINLHTLNQTNWVYDDDDNMLLDYVGYLHELPKSIGELNEKTGLNIPIPKKDNITNHTSYTNVYTPKLIEKVSEIYHKDITKFKFKFDD